MKNKVILITGSGFLATQLIKDILKLEPKTIRIMARSESRLAKLQDQFREYDNMMRYLVGDIRDKDRCKKACNGVDIVINTAALKRIDTCENNPIEAVETNINGVINMIEAATANNVKIFMQISTDKSMLPETTYGATKFVAEQLVINAHHYGYKTKFKVVRYGNVLGSTGSVLPIWEDQFKNNKPITVRDKDMTRFFMTVETASKLVIDTIINEDGGKIHSLPMKSVNIYDLAKYLYPNSEIIVTGCTNKEKIHEELYEGYSSKDHIISPKEMLDI